jgi:hypothetical protein
MSLKYAQCGSIVVPHWARLGDNECSTLQIRIINHMPCTSRTGVSLESVLIVSIGIYEVSTSVTEFSMISGAPHSHQSTE